MSSSLPLALFLTAVLLACQWFYIRTFFGRVEPALIARVERRLDVDIGFGLFHHWEIRSAGGTRSESERWGLQALVLGIQFGVMVAFALGIIVVIGLILTPAILIGRRG